MSASSFPRTEHVALLRGKIEDCLRLRGQAGEVAERGLNHLKCQYKFGVRSGPEEDWIEFAIHFQYADRCEKTGDDAEVKRQIDQFLNRHCEQSGNGPVPAL